MAMVGSESRQSSLHVTSHCSHCILFSWHLEHGRAILQLQIPLLQPRCQFANVQPLKYISKWHVFRQCPYLAVSCLQSSKPFETPHCQHPISSAQLAFITVSITSLGPLSPRSECRECRARGASRARCRRHVLAVLEVTFTVAARGSLFSKA